MNISMQTTRAGKQTGSMLIEVLIAILIFSIGILGIVGLQASAVKASTDAKYRSEAGLLANELIGRMWASNRTQATLTAAFSSATSGAGYQAWSWAGTTAGTSAAPALGTVLQTLPGAQANPPIVVVTPVPSPVGSTSLPGSLVTITIFWKMPNELDSAASHNYVAVAQIGG
jgi:type IV pilus assembly protein PilV